MDVGTFGFNGFGRRGFDLPAGSEVAVGPEGRARLRYNEVANQLEVSLNAAAYVAVGAGGGGSPGGASTQLQYNNAGAFGGTAQATYDGTNVTFTSAVFADGGVDRSGAATLTLGGTNATQINFGNATTNPTHFFDGTGSINFDGDLAPGVNIFPTQDSADGGAGRALSIFAGQGGNAVASPGGTGAAFTSGGGLGGDGTAGLAAGAGGNANISAGDAGTDNGGGGANGGNINLNAGAGSGSGLPGNVALGTSDVNNISIGSSTMTGVYFVRIGDNQALAYRILQGTDTYFQIDTTDGAERTIFGNTTINPDHFFDGTGFVNFDGDLALGVNIFPTKDSQDGSNGRAMAIFGGEGGDAVASAGGGGGTITLAAGQGGAGTAGLAAGAGAQVTISGGDAGTDNGGGGANGGSINLTAGSPTGTGTAGNITLSGANFISLLLQDNTNSAFQIREGGANTYIDIDTLDAAEQIVFGNATTNPDYVFVGSGDFSTASGVNVGFFGATPTGQSAAYTRNATVVEDRTLLASASATTTNNNNVLAALIADLQAIGILG